VSCLRAVNLDTDKGLETIASVASQMKTPLGTYPVLVAFSTRINKILYFYTNVNR